MDKPKTYTELLTGKGYKPGWYVLDKVTDRVKRGPFKHIETAGAVRNEMEMNATDKQNERWNLACVEVLTS